MTRFMHTFPWGKKVRKYDAEYASEKPEEEPEYWFEGRNHGGWAESNQVHLRLAQILPIIEHN